MVVTARDVTVTDLLPAGTSLSTTPGHEPVPAPTSIKVNANGTTSLIWKLGTIKSSDTPPSISYWVKISNTAGGTKVNHAIVTSSDDAGSPASMLTSGTNPHYAARTLNIDSLGGIQVDKSVITPFVQPRDVVTYAVTYANLDPIERLGMDVIDVLPYNGDGAGAAGVPGRQVPSAFHGTVRLREVVGTDVDTIRYTDAAPAAVYALQDPSAGAAGFNALPAGKKWCTAAEITAATSGCPASIGASTAVRITRQASLGANETATFTYSFDTPGSRSGDVYSNTAALRSSSLSLGTLSPTKTAKVVASTIGDFVWNDKNRNGRQDRGERGVAGVKVLLEGTDKHGTKVRVTTVTDSKGKYLFTSSSQSGQSAGIRDLVSGSYKVTFVKSTLPKGSSFTRRQAPGTSNTDSSKAHQSTGQTAVFSLFDPTPTKADATKLTLDAGIIVPVVPTKGGSKGGSKKGGSGTGHFTG